MCAGVVPLHSAPGSSDPLAMASLAATVEASVRDARQAYPLVRPRTWCLRRRALYQVTTHISTVHSHSLTHLCV